MSTPLDDALGTLRAAIQDDVALLRAVGSGRRRGQPEPPWRKVELRYVDLKAGRHLQIVRYDATQAHTSNHLVGEADAVVTQLLGEPFGNWHVETAEQVLQMRVTKKGHALLGVTRRQESVEPERGHDRDKERLLAPTDPLFAALGLADSSGRIKPSRMAKYRQVEEFVRHVDAALTDALSHGRLRTPTAEAPLRVVDLGCGNAYLTFAALRFLTAVRGLPVAMTGVDVKEQSREHNTAVAQALDLEATFAVGTIGEVRLPEPPEVVLALHACDTATDDALARAVGWGASLVLAAPCCHHDVAKQLRGGESPSPYGVLTRDGILRERFADTLTDALRALLLRSRGYRVDVVEFIASQHTPRNTLLRAVAGGRAPEARAEYDALVTAWGLRPRLGELLAEAGG